MAETDSPSPADKPTAKPTRSAPVRRQVVRTTKPARATRPAKNTPEPTAPTTTTTDEMSSLLRSLTAALSDELAQQRLIPLDLNDPSDRRCLGAALTSRVREVLRAH